MGMGAHYRNYFPPGSEVGMWKDPLKSIFPQMSFEMFQGVLKKLFESCVFENCFHFFSRMFLSTNTLQPRWCEHACKIQPQKVKIHNKDTGIIWPWDYLNYFWNTENNKKFLTWIHDPGCQSGLRCKEFWEHMEHHPFHAKLQLNKEDYCRTIPIAWHMDGVKVYKTHKAFVYSFSSLIRKGPSLDTKCLLLLIRDGDLVKPHTHSDIGILIGYIMDVLSTGNFPEKDQSGQPFKEGTLEFSRAGHPYAGGWRCAFGAFKADLEARVMVHQLTRNWAADLICEHCLASKHPDGFSYGDFSDNAAYLECIFTHEQFLMLNPPDRQSTWSAVRGWDKDRNLDVSQFKPKNNLCLFDFVGVE